MLASFEEIRSALGYRYYRAVLVPRIWKLSNYRTNEIFYQAGDGDGTGGGLSIDSIIGQVLEKAGILSAEYDIAGLSGNLLLREYRCQYHESDFDFISRLMENEGIFYYFEQGETEEKIIFINDQNYLSIQRARLVFDVAAQARFQDNCVYALSCRKQRLPENVIVRDYNPDEPSLDVSNITSIDTMGQGTEYIYGKNVLSDTEATYLSQIRAEEHTCRKTQFFGESSVTRLQAGYIFLLDGHPNPDYNGVEYLAVEVNHEGQHLDASLSSGGQNDAKPQYRNSFVAIPAEAQYRPPRKTPRPRITGTLHARIDGELDSEYAQLDREGRYKVSLPFDFHNEEHPEGLASARVRMMQPYAGTNQGMQFPLLKGTEVLLSFVDGDPDRPIIAGAINSAASPGPVNADNQSESVIQTGGNNRIRMEDERGSERIILETPTSNSWLRIGAPNDPLDGPVNLDGTGDDEIEYASNGIRMKSGGSIWMEALDHYGEFIAGAPTDATKNADLSDYPTSGDTKVTTRDEMIKHFQSATDGGSGNYRPGGLKSRFGAETESLDTALEKAHVKVSSLDTFTTQAGNIYDFGGYWNYNLGNSFAEEHINQGATLNNRGAVYWPKSQSTASADELMSASESGAGAGAATAAALGGAALITYTVSAISSGSLPHGTSIGGAIACAIVNTGAIAMAGAAYGAFVGAIGGIGPDGENFQDNVGDVISGPGSKGIKTWAEAVGSSFVSGSTSTQNAKPEDDYNESGTIKECMNTDTAWVTKQYGDAYNFQRGNDISIMVGHSETHQRGNTNEFVYGGIHQETKYNGDGRKVNWERGGGGYKQEINWHHLTGQLVSFEHKDNSWFSYEGNFVTVPTLAISTSMSTLRAEIDVSVGALDISASFALGVKMDISCTAGLSIEFERSVGGKLVNDETTNGFEFRAVGLKAAKKAELEADKKNLLLTKVLTDIKSGEIQLNNGKLQLSKSGVLMDVSDMKFF